MRIAVIDGQGGGMGKYITEKLRKEFGEAIEILALGTNAMATIQMLKGGANEGATGEHAIVYNTEKVDLIIGSLSIVLANSMLGELTPAMAAAVASSPAPKLLLPIHKSNVNIVGTVKEPLPHAMENVIEYIKQWMESE
jgi:hypothetical protein